MTFVENPRLRRRVLSAVGRAWERGQPLSKRPTDGDRFIARVVARGRIGVAIAIENELFAALRAKEIHEEVIARTPPTFGLRLANQPAKTGEDRAKTSPKRRRLSSPGKAKRLSRLDNFKGEDVGEDRAKTLGRPRKPLKRLARTEGEDTPTPSVAGSKRTAGALGAAPAILSRGGKQMVLGTPFAVGDVLFHRGQRFVCTEVVPCVRKDGTPSAWTVWRGQCADCQAPFDVKGYSKTFRPVQRRCDLHKSPLRRTKFGRRRRPKRRAAQ
jgi:hypothetical protein